MKKPLACMLAILLALVANAQEDRFGIKIGYNAANLKGDGILDDTDSKGGLYIGATAEFAFTDQFSIQPEIMYSAQGAKYELSLLGNIINTDIAYKVNYLNIPIMAKYYVLEGLGLMTGPQLGILLAAETEIDNADVDVKDELTSTDLSWAFGAAYRLPMGFGVELRYNLGLSDIDDKSLLIDDTFNRVFQIGVSYQLPL